MFFTSKDRNVFGRNDIDLHPFPSTASSLSVSGISAWGWQPSNKSLFGRDAFWMGSFATGNPLLFRCLPSWWLVSILAPLCAWGDINKPKWKSGDARINRPSFHTLTLRFMDCSIRARARKIMDSSISSAFSTLSTRPLPRCNLSSLSRGATSPRRQNNDNLNRCGPNVSLGKSLTQTPKQRWNRL